jgi:uncharacterized tellurite resistance protein B-like protein
LNPDEILRVASVLMGAVYADGEVDGGETATVYSILGQLVGERELPPSVRGLLANFEPEAFDLEATCAGLLLESPEDKKALLALVAEITDADDVHSCDEDDYSRRVARAIGASQDDLEGLTMDMVEISTLAGPPPVPGDA